MIALFNKLKGLQGHGQGRDNTLKNTAEGFVSRK